MLLTVFIAFVYAIYNERTSSAFHMTHLQTFYVFI